MSKKPYSQTDFRKVINELAPMFSDRLSLSVADRAKHAKQNPSNPRAAIPDAVVYPFSTDEVCQVVSLCNRYKIPVIAYGNGQSTQDQLMALQGGIAINLGDMNQVTKINAKDRICNVQAGVTVKALREALRYDKLDLACVSNPELTIGGFVANNVIGNYSLKYGTIRDALVGLSVVLADGKLHKFGYGTQITALGMDLTSHFIGSEGTLGVITDIQLKLQPKAERISYIAYQFSSYEAALDTTSNIVHLKVPVCAIYLATPAHKKGSTLEPLPTLLITYDGASNEIEKYISEVNDIAESFELKTTIDLDETEFFALTQLGSPADSSPQSNTSVYPSTNNAPEKRAFEIVVPTSRIKAFISKITSTAEKLEINCDCSGSVGMGHCEICFEYPAEKSQEVNTFIDDIRQQVMTIGGSNLGLSGIGLVNKSLFIDEQPDSQGLFRLIKQSLDPNNIMNPQKLMDK